MWETKQTLSGASGGKPLDLHWTAILKELPGGHVVLANSHAGPDQPQWIQLDAARKVVWQFNKFKLVGNSVACFDYIDPAQADRIRKKLAVSK